MYYAIMPGTRRILRRFNDYEEAAKFARDRVENAARNGVIQTIEVVQRVRVFSGDHGVVES